MVRGSVEKAVVDTNGNPENIDYPIPGNDDAVRAIELFTSKVAEAVIEGRKSRLEKELEEPKKEAEEGKIGVLVEVKALAEPFIRRRAIRHLEKDRIVVFSADPMLDKTAKKFANIHYLDVIKKGLKVMDSTAISLCKDNNLPILVFNLNRRGNIKRAVLGEKVGTLVY